MDICKNKKSNRYFIYIGKTGNKEQLLITPDAQIKSLKNDLFYDIEEDDEDRLLGDGKITEAQVKRFREYEQDRFDEIIDVISELSTSDKKRLVDRLLALHN